jgi:hypothetical protein
MRKLDFVVTTSRLVRFEREPWRNVLDLNDRLAVNPADPDCAGESTRDDVTPPEGMDL